MDKTTPSPEQSLGDLTESTKWSDVLPIEPKPDPQRQAAFGALAVRCTTLGQLEAVNIKPI